VDDVSQDETVEIAWRLGFKTIVHIQNKGFSHFRRGVVYSLATLWTLARYLAYKWRLAEVPQFSSPLHKVISRYHPGSLFGKTE
jgi:hypothetical protein